MSTLMPSRKVRLTILILSLLVAIAFLPVPPILKSKFASRNNVAKLQVLFVGNSFTFGNDLPSLIESISRKTELPIDTEMIAYGGVSLLWHSYNQTTLDAIKSRRWDYVVLQDCSICPLQYLPQFQTGTRKMVQHVKQAGSKPILYMTWADAGVFAEQKEIADQYSTIAKELGVALAPAGLAWEAMQREHPELNLYESDKHHAGLLGTAVTAYVFLIILQEHGNVPTNLELTLSPQRLYQLFWPINRSYADQTTAAKIRDIVVKILENNRNRDKAGML